MQYMNMNNAIREKGQLSVNGVGIVKVKSDLAILKVGVTTSNEDVQVAQVENTNTVNAVITSLTDYKIPRENINADDVVIKRIRDNATNQVIGYEITTNITIEVEDIKNLGDIYSLAIENGANSEVNISFTLSNVNHHYKKALLKATQDALNKGNLLSKSLNIRLKPLPESISENSTSIYSVSQKNIAYSSSPFLSSGDLEVKAQVGIVFNTFL
ncbi:periplasmic immunogenic protein [[Clostridium] sordellii]|uniref:SIMPL domain-containing protein n=1 Tax=Paraclostridium sordellii TaxID=1505 RepID=UPI0005DCDB97|nr:SIMPL domain-containing protein [Paeniclostridium sordellii]MBX9180606.1 SIMPL domain-containing protein [Paeniclostridium sordellii]CEO09298.1 periplasmic immunogenic protein [[Clostridium] sordellii] [Paeniclostridium sordellii]CEP84674.1 periplasmic immunogenic protein [[Clostridium] sordellii] [Paeniclostridium sordellii]